MNAGENRSLFVELSDALRGRGVRTEPESIAAAGIDETGRFGHPPLAVVEPSSIEEVASIIDVARRHRVALVPQGGRTSLVGGSVPARAGEIVLSTARMSEIRSIDLDTGSIHVEAGVTLAAIDAALSATPWRYAVDFAARESATIGGTVATNAGGPRVFRLGTTRDQLRGISAVLGTGERIDHLRGLRKDNTGFDVVGLLCGSEGTLGVVCEVRLQLIERPGAVVAAALGFERLEQATEAAWHIARTVQAAEEIELAARPAADLVADRRGRNLPVEGDWLLFARIAERNDARADEAVAELAHAVGARADTMVVAAGSAARGLLDYRDGISDALRTRGRVHKYDVSLAAATLTETLDDVGRRVSRADPEARVWLFGHVCDHNIHINVTDTDLASDHLDDLVLGCVIENGGSISAEHGIGVAKARHLARDRDAGSVATMRRIKAALDPDGVLNPGVLLSSESPAHPRSPIPEPRANPSTRRD